MARLSTHVLDTARGKPRRGVVIDLRTDAARRLVTASPMPMADGRTAAFGDHADRESTT